MADDQASIPAPHDIPSEQATLGAMMLSDRVIADIETLLSADDFYRPAHQVMFKALVELRDRSEPTDPVALAAHLLGRNMLSRVGGAEYLHTCYSLTPALASATHYARTVASCAVLRRLATVAERVKNAVGQTHYGDADVVLETARTWLSEVGTVTRKDTAPLWYEAANRMVDRVEEASNNPDAPPGLSTGWPDVDDVLQGLRAGELILVAARPGVGKSVVLLNLARSAAMKNKQRTILFTLEMSEAEVTLRIGSAGTGIPLSQLRAGQLDDNQWSRLVRYVGETEDAPLHIDETAKATLAHIRSVTYQKIAEHGPVDLILVDYIQLAESGGKESRQEQVGALSRGLKLLAKEIGCPIVAACQLNRGPEQRTDKRPISSDLRESGSLEQDADVVILLYREDIREQESPRAGECDVIIDKNRHGRMDTVTLAAQLHLSRFTSMTLPERTAP